tara:strand:- start:132 stop:1328 length:1197 start_codon:yes stop_codon:yes gene_type:complete
MRNFVIFFLILITIDFIFSQLFFLDILYKKKITEFKNDITYRIPNEKYLYTFKKNSSFEATYNFEFANIDYLINTNNLGLRDSSVRDLEKEKVYSIVIGDSFVEGTGLDYEDTLVGILNKKLNYETFKNFEFLNAGVASYSPYIYKEKIKSLINSNNWLNVNSVVILYDKSDVGDNLKYINKPKSFPTIKRKYKNPKKEKLLNDFKNFNFGSILTEQTMIGIFYRDVLGASIEKLIQNIKFRKILADKYNLNFLEISKEKMNTMYATHQYEWLQKYFYNPLWEQEGKKSIDFAFESFIELKSFLNERNIELYIVIYPWPFDLLDDGIRKKYLNYLNKKFLENDFNNLIVYDEFLKEDVSQSIFKYYQPKDVHFNRQGNLILSEKIFNTLSKDNLVVGF